MEHGEVQGKTQSDGVASVQRLAHLVGKLVVLQSAVLHGLELVSAGALGNVSVVVADHFVEEGLGLIGRGDLHAGVLHNVHDGDALVEQLLLDLLLVVSEAGSELRVLGVLLDGADGPDGSSLGSNLVLESNRKEVSLFGGEVLVLTLDHKLEVVNHVVESLGLLSDSGHKDVLF